MPVTLKPDVQELLREELAAFVEALPADQVPAEYAAVAAAVEAGELPDEVLGPVGALLEVGLQTGRIRKVHRAAAEQSLLRLYGQTPAGKQQAQTIAEVNAALAQLEGQQIETVRVLMRIPGSYLLQINTADCEMTLRFTPDGAGVDSVAVGV